MRYCIFGLGMLVLAGCATQSPPAQPPIVVEGEVVARGQAPFAELVLETAARNYYLLVFEREADRQAVAAEAPLWLRVEGTPYLDRWQGLPYTHLRVHRWERLR
ncbi:hypothetical protein [Rhodothermus profundi]|uniref:Uncharacterized protein n=1 Tax=Rhodothermus profundi TaxID=633813 RepID=A0A1M6TUF4_9BACT|nr:hypothetical protein [Rhodothermus profundi]SHK60571.1 hypothetical protein SAMN04488087_1539 [Rhodothermus profundi]